jgi:three-Cys-motif partner protein
LQSLVGSRNDVKVMHGDCNRLLLDEVLPEVRYEQYCRGLCILDPYGLHLNWEVIAKTGSMKSIEIFLNFPVADINRKVLWRDPLGVSPDDVGRMNAYWGDESWRNIAYTPSAQQGSFGHTEMEKTDNEVIAEAFRKRLKQVAGFRYVPKPLPMRNTRNAIVYYLFFASPNRTGGTIVERIFNSYRNRTG